MVQMVPRNAPGARVPIWSAAINAANQAGGANTIILAGGRTLTLTGLNITTDWGPTGLPMVAPNNNLTITDNQPDDIFGF